MQCIPFQRTELQQNHLLDLTCLVLMTPPNFISILTILNNFRASLADKLMIWFLLYSAIVRFFLATAIDVLPSDLSLSGFEELPRLSMTPELSLIRVVSLSPRGLVSVWLPTFGFYKKSLFSSRFVILRSCKTLLLISINVEMFDPNFHFSIAGWVHSPRVTKFAAVIGKWVPQSEIKPQFPLPPFCCH